MSSDIQANASSGSPAPTRVRYIVLAVATTAAALLYLERVCIGIAKVFIQVDLRLSDEWMSYAMAMFFWAYALGQVPSGWLTDRFGPRRMMTLYLVAWSVFGIAIAFSVDFWMLLLSRFLLGLSQAGAYPTMAVLVKNWTPAGQRGLANSIVAFGGRIGGAGANLLTAVLIVAFVPIDTPAQFESRDVIDRAKFEEQLRDEKKVELLPIRDQVRRAFLKQAAENPGVERPEETILALNALVRQPGVFDDLPRTEIALPRDAASIRAKPVSERSVRESERLNRLVLETAFPGSVRPLHTAGWRPTLFTFGMAGVFAALLFGWLVRDRPGRHPWCNAAEVELIAEGQTEIGTVQRTSIPWRSMATSGNLRLYSACQFFTNFGWIFVINDMASYLEEVFNVPILDRGLMTMTPMLLSCVGMLVGGWLTDRLARQFGLRWGRAIPIGAMRAPCIVAMLLCPWLPSAWAVTLALTVMAAFVDLGMPAIWSFAQDTSGRHLGAVVGWGNMWGNFGAGLSPILLAYARPSIGWNGGFYLLAGSFALATVTGLLIDASKILNLRQEEAGP